VPVTPVIKRTKVLQERISGGIKLRIYTDRVGFPPYLRFVDKELDVDGCYGSFWYED
jgi:hypothetical protein